MSFILNTTTASDNYPKKGKAPTIRTLSKNQKNTGQRWLTSSSKFSVHRFCMKATKHGEIGWEKEKDPNLGSLCQLIIYRYLRLIIAS